MPKNGRNYCQNHNNKEIKASIWKRQCGTFWLFGPKLPEECLEVFRKVSDNFLTQKELNDGQICCLRLRNDKIETKKGKCQCGTKFVFLCLPGDINCSEVDFILFHTFLRASAIQVQVCFKFWQILSEKTSKNIPRYW